MEKRGKRGKRGEAKRGAHTHHVHRCTGIGRAPLRHDGEKEGGKETGGKERKGKRRGRLRMTFKAWLKLRGTPECM